MTQETDNKKKKTTTKKKETKKETTTKKKTTTKKEPSEKVIPYEEKKEKIEEPVVESTTEDVVEENVEIVSNPVKNTSVFIYILIFLLLISMIYVVIHSFPKNLHKEDFISIGVFEEKMIDDLNYKKVSSEEDLQELFLDKSFSGLNFDKYQYIVLEYHFDPCSTSSIQPVDYVIQNGKLIVTVQFKASCGGCMPEYNYFLLELPKKADFVQVEYRDHALNDPRCPQDVAYKPILYFYPKEKTDIEVQLGNANLLTTTYPLYENGWKFTAYPDGTLKDPKTNREYYALFWEGDQHPSSVHEEGYVVKGKDCLSFLEEKLSILGLTNREANEFIIYWLPQLERNTYNYIYFESMTEINQYMPLTITPTPDSMIRIQMDYLPLEEKIPVKEQKLKTPKRNGFTVVEWGGSIIKD